MSWGWKPQGIFIVAVQTRQNLPTAFLRRFAWHNPPLTSPKPARRARPTAGTGNAVRNAHCNAIETGIPASFQPPESPTPPDPSDAPGRCQEQPAPPLSKLFALFWKTPKSGRAGHPGHRPAAPSQVRRRANPKRKRADFPPLARSIPRPGPMPLRPPPPAEAAPIHPKPR